MKTLKHQSKGNRKNNTKKKGGMDRLKKIYYSLINDIDALKKMEEERKKQEKKARKKERKEAERLASMREPTEEEIAEEIEKRESSLLKSTISKMRPFIIEETENLKKEKEAAEKAKKDAERAAEKAKREAEKAAAEQAKLDAIAEETKRRQLKESRRLEHMNRIESKKTEKEKAELENIYKMIDSNMQMTIDANIIDKHHLLHVACEKNSITSFESLLNANPNIEEVYEGKTPLDHAIEHNHPEIIQLLLDHGACTKEIYKKMENLDNNIFKLILKHISQKLIDGGVADILQNSDLCAIIKKTFSTFSTSRDEQKYCTVFILLALLCKAYHDFCDIVIKGGKAIQLNVTSSNYNSDDIDIIIIPKYEYIHLETIAQEIGDFIASITGFSLLNVPDPSNIIKISYQSQQDGRFVALADIGYGYHKLTPSVREKLYRDFIRKDDFKIGGLTGSIKYLRLGNLILEKLYYIYAYSEDNPLFLAQTDQVKKDMEYIKNTQETINKQKEIVTSLRKYKLNRKFDAVLEGLSESYKTQLASTDTEQIETRFIKQKMDNIKSLENGLVDKSGKVTVRGLNPVYNELRFKMGEYIKQFALVQREYRGTVYCINDDPNLCVDVGNNHFLEKSREHLFILAKYMTSRDPGKMDKTDLPKDPDQMLSMIINQYNTLFPEKSNDPMMDELIKYSILHHEWFKPTIWRKNSMGKTYVFREYGMQK